MVDAVMVDAIADASDGSLGAGEWAAIRQATNGGRPLPKTMAGPGLTPGRATGDKAR